MQIIADLHIHSKYSRAVSQKMDLHGIGMWASLKGIGLVSTGDWTHPIWFREISNHLYQTSEGIYELKKPLPEQKHKVRFMLTTEISSIYSQGGTTRRVHNVVFSPSIQVAEKVNKEFIRRGANLMADGRPITGISSLNLLEMLLAIDNQIMLIPAHIWTPWFSLFGSKSGFNSVEECFGVEGAKHIYGIETGLSSDPIMNWQIKELETRSILSFSDAHSGPKLAREATVFISTNNQSITDYSYSDITDAIKQRPESKLKIGYTIEFFPEEGKYHWTGHRACNVKYSPLEEAEKGTVCPVCGKPLTVGVESRVKDLSNRTLSSSDLLFAQNKSGLTFVDDKEKRRKPFVSIIPLLEIMAELEGGAGVKAERAYHRALGELGTEFDILLKIPFEAIEKFGGKRLRQAIEIIRSRKAHVDPGYDGVFGTVKIFKDEENKKQTTLF
ncbi:hypothetical protein A2334_01575 [Candidatus Roizmanbacteria bacterium RIFOXYB2_FULL_38_10]|uniref:DNA helicase UvrD n=1 Tax=Candidatus Roizmanbacteria bacterium RIFOXYD1_FULL_38_12 TaxID=1802093 RepID=A0A1F7L274_9BACT|nr:MAG: hypothetical protein A3K47_05485 [Candidatus Roizmanbacteria bacterium RIFOXYA2_FULL_38_14]OGK64196.1 MAG: hypothetical protein A3K27_05485 [Candidatus Roizmanbacteria bacterium RIFOXYA1_FULL_37_12]OGK66042.1 MAG: hypothetical protein A3K38_05485 [Candidatus Roizmanbacteria bacterium RIFOXYB1_FULL_40_23]OGK68539.1 MAG: hypothetical protein A2334_01575 [Candidatus Roizmanbacteria bacterium RIFOXYB2_FULL_38_10]OGK70447.1 MAG: hypothetical protein A3K21_05490 [Candidatus Roizmanbacteria ba